MATAPHVAIIVVDHDGGEMTVACLTALAATEWTGPALRVVLVDNSPTRPLSPDQLAAFPAVEVLRPGRNIGFPAAVDLALDHLRAGLADGPDFVALVNNDAFVQPGWLQPLVDALQADPGVGAAQGKLLFEPQFAPITIEAPLVTRARGPAVGVRVDGPAGTVHSAAFAAVRPGEWWSTQREAVVFVPAPPDAEHVTMSLHAQRPGVVTIDGRGLAVGPEASEVTVAVSRERVSVVQNAGNELTADWWVRDRGAAEVDDGRFDDAQDIWGWCGGLVLLRSSYLADVGRLDGRLFLYWEDVDLSWRGAAKGWRYRYVPMSVARHRHGASLGQRSPLFERLNQRNRLVILARHAGLRVALRAFGRTLAESGWFVWTDVVRAVIARRRPSLARTRVRLQAVGGALVLLARRPSR